jgi:hypothetical protein
MKNNYELFKQFLTENKVKAQFEALRVKKEITGKTLREYVNKIDFTAFISKENPRVNITALNDYILCALNWPDLEHGLKMKWAKLHNKWQQVIKNKE